MLNNATRGVVIRIRIGLFGESNDKNSTAAFRVTTSSATKAVNPSAASIPAAT